MILKKVARTTMLVVACLLMAVGVASVIVPYAVSFYLDHKVSMQIEAVEGYRKNRNKEDGITCESESDGDVTRKEADPLYQAMSSYNDRIYSEGQAGIIDIGTFEALPEELASVVDGAIGYIEIPSIDVKLPLYVGATTDNMASGAAILSNTSMPIGGENTNCVIAGHRGYYGGKFFKDIEEISVGDSVFVTNPWETLEYIVEGFDIIEPSDADAVKIRDGKELVTLLTCHPYASNGRYRYLVYCVPVSSAPDINMDDTQVDDDSNGIALGDTETTKVFESSQSGIRTEEILRLVSVCLMCIAIIIYVIYMIRRRRKK